MGSSSRPIHDCLLFLCLFVFFVGTIRFIYARVLVSRSPSILSLSLVLIPAARASSAALVRAMMAKARLMAADGSGATGKWAPCGWNPFSSATKVRAICSPSGELYDQEPRDVAPESSGVICFWAPSSSRLTPSAVSNLFFYLLFWKIQTGKPRPRQ